MKVALVIWPRQSVSWEAFCHQTPPGSIALDGLVVGGPKLDEDSLRANFDHHSGVVRAATMSTARQVYFAIMGGLLEQFAEAGELRVYINDPDQDTCLATWFLMEHALFLKIGEDARMTALLDVCDRLDITAGAFPMVLDDPVVRQYNWVFSPYCELRKSGMLAMADAAVMRSTVLAVHANLEAYFQGRAEERPFDTRHELLHVSGPYRYWVVDEIGGTEARSVLFSRGLLDRYVSLVARRPDGRFIYTIGRRSQHIPNFPLRELYAALNAAEGLDAATGWNGSDIVGGSSRERGSCLEWQQVCAVIDRCLATHFAKKVPRLSV
jgi:hypothetical protein